MACDSQCDDSPRAAGDDCNGIFRLTQPPLPLWVTGGTLSPVFVFDAVIVVVCIIVVVIVVVDVQLSLLCLQHLLPPQLSLTLDLGSSAMPLCCRKHIALLMALGS